MNKIVYLENLKFCRFTENTPFTITENDILTFTFKSLKYKLAGAIVTLTNGKIKRAYTIPADGVITPDKDLLQVGRIDINVNGAREWVVDGIKITEAETGLIFEPTLQAMRADLTAEIEAVKQSVATIKSDELQADNTLAAAVEELSKQIQTIKVSFDEQLKNIENRLNILEDK